MAINIIKLNDIKYISLQYTYANKQQVIDFIKNNHYCLLDTAMDIISFMDTYGDTIKIVLNDWIVIADGDNTESYVLDVVKYNKMFNLC